MAQFYTLEEAARVLGMNPEDLKAKAQHRKVRAFLDGGTWRFRVGDVDELARRRGMGSDAELPLSDLDMPAASWRSRRSKRSTSPSSSSGSPTPTSATPTGRPERPPGSDSGDQDILLDDLSLPPDPIGGSSSVIIGMQTTGGRMPSDSDVRLIPDNPSGRAERFRRPPGPHEFRRRATPT